MNPLGISTADLKALERFHGAGVVVDTVGGGSSFKDRVHRHGIYRFGSKKCRRCRGSGFVTVATRIANNPRAAELAALLDIYKRDLPPAADAVCTTCEGRGVVLSTKTHNKGPMTVQYSKTALKGGTGSAPAHPDVRGLTQWRLVQPRVQRLAREYPFHAQVMAVFLSPSDRYARLGPIRVWQFTAPGQTLAHQRPEQTYHDMEVELRQTADAGLALMVRECNRAAEELLQAVGKSWNLVTVAERRRVREI